MKNVQTKAEALLIIQDTVRATQQQIGRLVLVGGGLPPAFKVEAVQKSIADLKALAAKSPRQAIEEAPKVTLKVKTYVDKWLEQLKGESK